MRIKRRGAVIEDDLPAIYAFIAKDNPAAAERVLDAVDATLNLLAGQPEIGVHFRSRNPTLRNVRMIPVIGFNNYLVFYRITEGAGRVASRAGRCRRRSGGSKRLLFHYALAASGRGRTAPSMSPIGQHRRGYSSAITEPHCTP